MGRIIKKGKSDNLLSTALGIACMGEEDIRLNTHPPPYVAKMKIECLPHHLEVPARS